MTLNPKLSRGIVDKIMLVWELNSTWTIAQVIDNAYYALTVEEGACTLRDLSDEQLNHGLDLMLEGSRKFRV